MKKVTIFLCLLFTLTMLQGCKGGGSGSSNSTVRLVNGASNPQDLYWSGSGSATALISNVSYGSVNSTPQGISAGVSSLSLAPAGGTPSGGTQIGFTGGNNYTIMAFQAYSSGTPSTQLAWWTDNVAVPISGVGLITVADFSGAGSLDVYMGIGSSTPTLWKSGIIGTTTPPSSMPYGTYHIQVVGTGTGYNGTDVRLDIPAAIIGNQQILTLALTPTTGGTLVDGLLVLQEGLVPQTGQSAVTSYKNGSARVRIAASFVATGNSPINTAKANGVSLLGPSLSSGSVSSYVPVPLIAGLTAAAPQATGVSAGAQSLPITINGSAITLSGSCTSATATATPGQDLTLLVFGSASSPQYCLLNDDNTLAASGSAKIRLVNGVNNLATNISLTYGGLYQQNAVFAAASTATSVPIPGGSPYALVGSPVGGTSLGSPALEPQGVYSVFMLGDYTSTPSAVLTTDHTYQKY